MKRHQAELENLRNTIEAQNEFISDLAEVFPTIRQPAELTALCAMRAIWDAREAFGAMWFRIREVRDAAEFLRAERRTDTQATRDAYAKSALDRLRQPLAAKPGMPGKTRKGSK